MGQGGLDDDNDDEDDDHGANDDDGDDDNDNGKTYFTQASSQSLLCMLNSHSMSCTLTCEAERHVTAKKW